MYFNLAAEDQPERPLSAENLLPEPSIASMTSSAAASRLTSVLQGTGAPITKALTRQQTFPPPQPYVRPRYMSATVEMSTCAEAVLEGKNNHFLFELKWDHSHALIKNIEYNAYQAKYWIVMTLWTIASFIYCIYAVTK